MYRASVQRKILQSQQGKSVAVVVPQKHQGN